MLGWKIEMFHKPHKYNVVSKERRTACGITFDSMAEMNCLTVIAQIARLQLNDEFAERQTSRHYIPFLIALRNGVIRHPQNLKISSLSNFKERYLELKLLEKSGIISALELQPKFLLIPKTEKGGRSVYYIADFKYTKDGKTIYEDVKGVKTDVYKLKKKLLFYKYPDICFFENKV